MTTYGLLIFEGAGELGSAGPWRVFTASASIRAQDDRVVLVAAQPGPVRCGCGCGMQVRPSHTFGDHPPLDVLLVAGGPGACRAVSSPAVVGWIRTAARDAAWRAGVGPGVLLLHAAGLTRGRRVATHLAYADRLEARGDVTVVRDLPYVADGRLVTSQGAAAALDMALWLVGRIHGRDHARAVRGHIQ
ncbi:MAG TPA: DJ-1/PfpI family protein [Streptosporangiaceae bacterium]